MNYEDAYLAGLVTTDREQRAAADVALAGTFPADWTERLVVLRVYILICLESTAAPDDAFSAKLAHYRSEYRATLRAAQAAAAGETFVFAALPLDRA